MKIIDPHLHLFDLRKGQYNWLKADSPPFWPDKHVINQYFCELDLALEPPLELAGFVHIEAGFDNEQPWRELDYLETHCQLPFRSVAFADICASDFSQTLDKLLRRPSLCGIRYILDEQANKVLSNKRVQQNLQLLAYHQLSFDAQFNLSDNTAVTYLCKILSNAPQLKVIINHAGWPPAVADKENFTNLQHNLTQLSQFQNVAIKLSGWEMANRQWQVDDVVAILDDTLQIMGEHRVMLASNFPLCLWRSSYQQLWLDYTQKLPLDEEQLKHLCYQNAAHWYKFEP
jgi:L-fuconolactonase